MVLVGLFGRLLVLAAAVGGAPPVRGTPPGGGAIVAVRRVVAAAALLRAVGVVPHGGGQFGLRLLDVWARQAVRKRRRWLL